MSETKSVTEGGDMPEVAGVYYDVQDFAEAQLGLGRNQRARSLWQQGKLSCDCHSVLPEKVRHRHLPGHVASPFRCPGIQL